MDKFRLQLLQAALLIAPLGPAAAAMPQPLSSDPRPSTGPRDLCGFTDSSSMGRNLSTSPARILGRMVVARDGHGR